MSFQIWTMKGEQAFRDGKPRTSYPAGSTREQKRRFRDGWDWEQQQYDKEQEESKWEYISTNCPAYQHDGDEAICSITHVECRIDNCTPLYFQDVRV